MPDVPEPMSCSQTLRVPHPLQDAPEMSHRFDYEFQTQSLKGTCFCAGDFTVKYTSTTTVYRNRSLLRSHLLLHPCRVILTCPLSSTSTNTNTRAGSFLDHTSGARVLCTCVVNYTPGASQTKQIRALHGLTFGHPRRYTHVHTVGYPGRYMRVHTFEYRGAACPSANQRRHGPGPMPQQLGVFVMIYRTLAVLANGGDSTNTNTRDGSFLNHISGARALCTRVVNYTPGAGQAKQIRALHGFTFGHSGHYTHVHTVGYPARYMRVQTVEYRGAACPYANQRRHGPGPDKASVMSESGSPSCQ